MRRFFALVLVLTLVLAGGLFAVNTAQAQGGTLAYGDVIDGELTDEAFEVEYTFTGSADDLVVIRMWSEGFENVLQEPALALATADNEIVASTTDHFSIVDAMLIATLPADGEYTILATRRDGSTGDSVGAYRLSLETPEVLAVGTPVSGTVNSEGKVVYVIEASEPFTLRYKRTSGTFAPELSLDQPGDTGELDSYAVLSGGMVMGGSLDVDVTEPTRYFVVLKQALFDFSFDATDAEYTLELAPVAP